MRNRAAAIPQIGRRCFGKTAIGKDQVLGKYTESRQKSDVLTIVEALKACSSSRDLITGMRIHADLIDNNSELITNNISLANTLVSMYSKCGSIENARQVFDNSQKQRSLVSWNVMIMAYACNGEAEIALDLFAGMQEQGWLPDTRTYIAALKACTESVASKGKEFCLENGLAIHSHLAKSDPQLFNNMFVGTSLVDMYAKCGRMEDARGVFDRMKNRNVVCWTALISGYAQVGGEEDQALKLLSRMLEEGFAPNDRTFIAAVTACSNLAAKEEAQKVEKELIKLKCLEKGFWIHSLLANRVHHPEIFLASSLVDMFAKCGSMRDARRVFDRMMQYDLVSWTCLIHGYAQSGQGDLALELFHRMQDDGGMLPNARSFVAALIACSSLAEDEEGRLVGGKLLKLVTLEKGRAVHLQLAKLGFDQDSFVGSSLVDMYSKCGSSAEASAAFHRISRRDIVSWNSFITGLVICEEGEKALQQFACMEAEGVPPNGQSFVAAFKACSCLVALETGRSLHAELVHAGLENEAVNSLISFYGYSHQGDAEEVFRSFQALEKEKSFRMDGITFLAILNVCAHAGLVEKGKNVFQVMCSSKYCIVPGIEHYTCMVDLLGRTGHLDDAVKLLKDLPVAPSVKIWKALLSSCRKWKNVEAGKLAFEEMLKLDDKDAAAYALMANVYASSGMWEKFAGIQTMRRSYGASKRPGQSWWIDSGGRVHRFVVGDTSHPQGELILSKLKSLMVRAEEQGYLADVNSAWRGFPAEDLCGHSEKLAICCALINTGEGVSIRIAKNLRVCVDCHQFTCVLSKVERRRIVCRDSNRFHVFDEGSCSCGNFWIVCKQDEENDDEAESMDDEIRSCPLPAPEDSPRFGKNC